MQIVIPREEHLVLVLGIGLGTLVENFVEMVFVVVVPKQEVGISPIFSAEVRMILPGPAQ
ncbi:hypothetical protein HanPI659440_Chr05g0196361 [Helianthus annuus]|nr:hypothetical protein HanPI659440_Chr05g0196361 [Helianthus annuus]